MATPRPQARSPWTWADHLDNERRLQRAADQKLWERLGRLIGLRGYQLKALLARFMDDRLAAAFRAHAGTLVEQLTDPTQAGRLRAAVVDLISDDLIEMIQILTRKRRTNDRRDPEKASGSGGPNAAKRKRQVPKGRTEPDDRGDAFEG